MISSVKATFGSACAARILPQTVALVVIPTAIYIGVSARLVGLNLLQLATDEYYFVRGVQFILEHGVPMFPTGGYYSHGLLAQYVTAASVLMFGENGFGYRLPSVIFSLGSVVLLYIYSRRVLGQIAAGLLCAIILISSWQIEFARFIRMYSQLQFLTVLFFLLFDKAFFQDKWRWRYSPHLVALAATLTHAVALLFLPFLFAPFFLEKVRARFASRASMLRFGFISASIVMGCVGFARFNVRRLGIAPALPEGYNYPFQTNALTLPDFPFWAISEDPLYNLLFFFALCSMVVGAWVMCRWFGRSATEPDLFLSLLLVSTIFHMFLLSCALLLILFSRYRLHQIQRHPWRCYGLLLATFGVGAVWVAYALFTQSWLNEIPLRQPTLAKALARTFFGWPELYRSIFVPWFKELPILGLLALLALGYQFVSNLQEPLWRILRNPAFIVLYIAVWLGIVQSHYATTRYLFFVYPLVLLSIALTAADLLTRVAQKRVPERSLQAMALFGCLGLFLFTEDFNPAHLRDVSNERVRFRIGEFQRRALTWYPRTDYASPARFVDEYAAADPDTRIIVLSQPVLSYYLARPHAVFYEREGRQFYNVSRVHGTVDLWSNQKLLSTDAELRDYTRNSHEVFLVRRILSDESFEIASIWEDRAPSAKRVFESTDGRLEVVHVHLQD